MKGAAPKATTGPTRFRSNLATALSELVQDDRTVIRTLALWRATARPGDFDEMTGRLSYARLMIQRYGVCR